MFLSVENYGYCEYFLGCRSTAVPFAACQGASGCIFLRKIVWGIDLCLLIRRYRTSAKKSPPRGIAP
jgi:hypothetical protein